MKCQPTLLLAKTQIPAVNPLVCWWVRSFLIIQSTVERVRGVLGTGSLVSLGLSKRTCVRSRPVEAERWSCFCCCCFRSTFKHPDSLPCLLWFTMVHSIYYSPFYVVPSTINNKWHSSHFLLKSPVMQCNVFTDATFSFAFIYGCQWLCKMMIYKIWCPKL